VAVGNRVGTLDAFLPDEQFNVTANMGVYAGAVAGALQVGAMVSPNAAVNAGVAKGFNKNGKVGARAAVTFGSRPLPI